MGPEPPAPKLEDDLNEPADVPLCVQVERKLGSTIEWREAHGPNDVCFCATEPWASGLFPFPRVKEQHMTWRKLEPPNEDGEREWGPLFPYGVDSLQGDMVTCGSLLRGIVMEWGSITIALQPVDGKPNFFAHATVRGGANYAAITTGAGASIPEAIARLYLAL